jgi:pimeloyl-ACP methyl ester carboxylesterase
VSTWVLLRGLTRESRHWGGFVDDFRGRFPDDAVFAPDLPGNGCRYRMSSPWTVEEMATQCRMQLLEQGVRPPYRLLALSLGAMVAIAWAKRHPEELAGCVLINTSVRPFSPFYRRLRLPSVPSLLRLALLAPGSPRREKIILRLTSRTHAGSTALLDQWRAIAREHPVSRANALRQLVAAARFRAPRTRPQLPLLILASAADALVDPRCSRRLAACWRCDLVEHPGAGHDLPLDDGPWVAAQVHRWLASSSAVAAPGSGRPGP